MIKSKLLVLIAVAGFMAWGCGDEEEHHDTHWSYSGTTGPSHWGDLKTEYATCKTGTKQSPIDIDTKTAGHSLAAPTFTYKAGTWKVIDNGHTIQVNVPAGSKVDLRGHSYDLLQFHFHAKSENTVDGKYYDMEMHLVHKDSAGKLAVVGVFLDGSTSGNTANAELAKIWSNIPTTQNVENAITSTTLDPTKLLPTDTKEYYNWEGSLTTPPCTEGVDWNLIKTPLKISAAQLAAFQKLYKDNYRPTQKLNGRKINESGAAHSWGYDGATGPSHWGDLKTEYATCKTGKKQSPIDIKGATTGTLAALKFTTKEDGFKIIDNGHTVQVTPSGANKVDIRGTSYDLVQFHFHAKSENTLAGKQFDMEMHMVHKNSAGKLAVVGVWLDGSGSTDNAELAKVWKHMPTSKEHEETITADKVDPAKLLPTTQTYYNWDGSLTTPPCTEGVDWNMMKNPITISAAQLTAFQKLYTKNFRPVQALSSRTITESK